MAPGSQQVVENGWVLAKLNREKNASGAPVSQLRISQTKVEGKDVVEFQIWNRRAGNKWCPSGHGITLKMRELRGVISTLLVAGALHRDWTKDALGIYEAMGDSEEAPTKKIGVPCAETTRDWLRLEDAAPRMSCTTNALRARCLRAPTRQDGNRPVSDLGGGIIAIKFGRHWRVRIPAS